MQTSCRKCQEVHFRVQILIETKIWTHTFCPLRKCRNAGKCLGMIKTVNEIFQEYAESLLNECGYTNLHSASCPRPSGRQVLKGVRPRSFFAEKKNHLFIALTGQIYTKVNHLISGQAMDTVFGQLTPPPPPPPPYVDIPSPIFRFLR